MKRNEAVISYQIQLIKDELSKLLPYGTNYALIDFPDHQNVGDSAIWLGEIELLKQVTGNKPSYVAKLEHFNKEDLARALPIGPILMHGGGNFGDIWPWYQNFRESIIADYPDRLIIQLPQTISFKEISSITRCARIIENHNNYHLMVRDKNSLEFAIKHFQCNTKLVPDSAFGIGAIKRIIEAKHQIYMLLREDAERADYNRELLKSVKNSTSDDWLYEPESFSKYTKIISGAESISKLNWNKNQARETYYFNLANGRLKRGLKMLSSGRQVITDRLHAHILSTLLDIPHVAIDNNYGKISGYINTWTHSYLGVQHAKTSEEALEKLSLLPSL